MAQPKISLDQWAALVSVVDSGGYARAGEALHKSQSTLTYAIQRLEELLGVKVFEIQVDVLDADPRLRPGLSATVTIHVGTFSDVTYAPVEAIFREEGRTFAYVRRMHRVRQVPVECGGSNDKFVIIVSGLQPGERVLLAQPS